MGNKTDRPIPSKIRKEDLFKPCKRKKTEDCDIDSSFEILDTELKEDFVFVTVTVDDISLEHLLTKRRKLKQILAISNSIEDLSGITDSLGKRTKLHAQNLLVTIDITLDDLSILPNIDIEFLRLLNLFIDDAISLVAIGTEFDVKFQSWKESMDEQLALLNDIVKCLDKIQRDVDIAKLSGASGGIVGGTLAIVGVALSTVTFGASLGLTIAGISIGAASGAVSIGARFGGWVHERKKQKSVEELVKSNEKKTHNIIRLMREVANLANRTSAVSYEFKLKRFKTQPDCCNVTISVVKTSVGVARGSARVFTALDETLSAAFTASAKLATKTAGIVLASIGLLVDAIDLVVTSQHVHDGSVSEVAAKIRGEVIPAVEAETEEIVALQDVLLTRDGEEDCDTKVGYNDTIQKQGVTYII